MVKDVIPKWFIQNVILSKMETIEKEGFVFTRIGKKQC